MGTASMCKVFWFRHPTDRKCLATIHSPCTTSSDFVLVHLVTGLGPRASGAQVVWLTPDVTLVLIRLQLCIIIFIVTRIIAMIFIESLAR